jgi:hypothetical protein
MWLDREGKIVWISNMNSSAYQKYKGLDLSYRPYFSVPKDYSSSFYSSLIKSNDKVPRLYISYPILSKQGNEYNNNNLTKIEGFRGVVVTEIRMDTLGDHLKNQLFPHFNNTMGLLDDMAYYFIPTISLMVVETFSERISNYRFLQIQRHQ